uniref:kunitz trypsin inhibitor 5-like n=1 Tax=Erigeron canadensis TaxID=72917 RepID=UPI001CB8ED30|nr:kunitz trypsin inhibitor 5-like [Erigeron canadensis]
MNKFFIFIFLCTLSLSTSVPVRDIDRNVLRSGTNYYILPVIHGNGGGITLAPGRNQPCPNDVALENNEKSNGLPMRFVPAANSSKDNIIHESVDLNIVFSVAGKCIPTPVWRVENYEGGRILSSHGMVGSPGVKTRFNWFKIEKYENDYYRLVFCPSVCQECVCADISSTIAKNGRRVLVLHDINIPLKVKFKKA